MSKNPHYIYDLPFQPRRELCRILDADRKWEELGGMYSHIDITTLTLLRQAVLRDRGPSWELLDILGERNGTIKQLFVKLSKMDHQRGMSVLLPYVEMKYHALVRSDTLESSDFEKKFSNDVPRFLLSSSFFSDRPSGACALNPRKNVPNSDFRGDPPSQSSHDVMNIREDISTLRIQTKLNSLNQHQHSRNNNNAFLEIPPDMRNFRAEAANCDESNTDNCASEKMKNVRKVSQTSQDLIPEMKKNVKGVVPAKETGKDLNLLEKSLPDVMKISYKDLLKATDDFIKTRILGRGGFGAVYKGEWKGTSVAIKRLMPREGRDNAARHLVSLKQSLNELTILKCCRFDHILPLYGVSLDGPEPCLVYQLMVNGSLEDRLLCRNDTAPLTWSLRSNIAQCTAKGLNYLHTTPGKPLIHGDIKSANILLDSNMEAKIGDFGLTREGPGCEDTHVKVSKLHGTECYLPPEYLRHRQLSPQVDIYSYGIVLLEMATGLRPYDVHRDEAKLLVDFVSDCHSSGRLDSIRDAKAGEENMMWFGELIKLGQECSSREKKKRPTMQHVLDCFSQIKDELSMVDKIRRLSNDRGSMGDTSKLKQLTPRELQMFYDICKEKYGITGTSSAASTSPHSPSSPPNDASIAVSAVHDGSPGNPMLTEHFSEIRPSKSAYGADHKCPSILPVDSDCPSSNVATKGSEEAKHTKSNETSSSDEPSSNGKAPVPLLTVLQLQVSEVSRNSAYSEASKTNQSISDVYDLSSCGYSVDSAMS